MDNEKFPLYTRESCSLPEYDNDDFPEPFCPAVKAAPVAQTNRLHLGLTFKHAFKVTRMMKQSAYLKPDWKEAASVDEAHLVFTSDDPEKMGQETKTAGDKMNDFIDQMNEFEMLSKKARARYIDAWNPFLMDTDTLNELNPLLEEWMKLDIAIKGCAETLFGIMNKALKPTPDLGQKAHDEQAWIKLGYMWRQVDDNKCLSMDCWILQLKHDLKVVVIGPVDGSPREPLNKWYDVRGDHVKFHLEVFENYNFVTSCPGHFLPSVGALNYLHSMWCAQSHVPFVSMSNDPGRCEYCRLSVWS